MKKLTYMLFAFAGLLFASCLGDDDDNDNQPKLELEAIITFEDSKNFKIDASGVSIGHSFVSDEPNAYIFENYYDASMDYNSGFTVSNKCDTKTKGYENQYSVYSSMTANLNNGKNFAIYNPCYYGDCFIKRVDGKNFKPYCVDIAATTYTYLSVLEGDDYAKKFTDKDSLCVVFKGYDAYGIAVSTLSVPLIYKGGLLQYDSYYGHGWMLFNNVSAFNNLWVPISLHKLGIVNKIGIEFRSSDVGQFGINTPQYVALDNFVTEALQTETTTK